MDGAPGISPGLALMLLLLLWVANGAPVLAARLLRQRGALPLDGGLRFVDGRPLLGPSKTVRGILVSLAATALAAPLLGLTAGLGFVFAAASMGGDLFSSFIKRRLGITSSGQAIGLDQVPEALFPLLLCRQTLGLDAWSIGLLVMAFTVGQLLLSPVMFRLGIRKRPW